MCLSPTGLSRAVTTKAQARIVGPVSTSYLTRATPGSMKKFVHVRLLGQDTGGPCVLRLLVQTYTLLAEAEVCRRHKSSDWEL